MKEEWRAIVDFPNYAVSNMGRIKRINNTYGTKDRVGELLKPYRSNKNGYVYIALYKNKKSHNKTLHSLLLKSFICERPTDKHHCNHINGNKQDNRLENLEWVTPSENLLHAIHIGLRGDGIGENNVNSKLKKGEVWLIKKLLHHKIKQRIIAKMFNVTRPNITSINTNKTWESVRYD